MNPTMIFILTMFTASIGQVSILPMMPMHNRPLIFMGQTGDKRFHLLQMAMIVLTLSMVVWSFINVGFFLTVILAIVCLLICPIIIRLVFPALFLATALAPIVSAVGLFIINIAVWF